jgi:hypothetical protein
MKNNSIYPCPICKNKMFIVGVSKDAKKIGSCGCKFHFKKTRSEKEMDKKYVQMPWGLELVKE